MYTRPPDAARKDGRRGHDGCRGGMFALRNLRAELALGVGCNVLLFENVPDDPTERVGQRWPLGRCAGFELAGFAVIGSTADVT